MLGEANAFDIVSRHDVHSLVLVVIMPFYAKPGTFQTPDAHEIGAMFMEAPRQRSPQKPALLGCARPPGGTNASPTPMQSAGLDGVAFPADGAVAVATMAGRAHEQAHSCCSIKLGDAAADARAMQRELRHRHCRSSAQPGRRRRRPLLAQSGLSVVAIDRKQRAGEPVQCAELVPALFAHHAPLGPAIAQPIAAMHTYVEARPKHVQPCFPGHIISRTRFDSDLVAQAQDAGAGVILGQRVTCIRRDGMIGLSDGREIFAAVIIAADGPRSLIGAAAGRTNAALIETRQITVPLRAPHDATDIFLSADIPGGYGWLFPSGHGPCAGVDAAFRTRRSPA
ncbi:MAG: hypothetical protein R3C25_07530 [Hyphomonadaceae bacterium]